MGLLPTLSCERKPSRNGLQCLPPLPPVTGRSLPSHTRRGASEGTQAGHTQSPPSHAFGQRPRLCPAMLYECFQTSPSYNSTTGRPLSFFLRDVGRVSQLSCSCQRTTSPLVATPARILPDGSECTFGLSQM